MTKVQKIYLEQILNNYTVAQLKEMCELYSIVGISSKRKAQIIEKLVDEITEIHTFKRNCFLASRKEIVLLEKAKEEVYRLKDEETEILYWIKCGYVGVDNNCHIVVAEEIKRLYEQLTLSEPLFWDARERFHTILDYIHASIHLYGVLSKNDFVKIFNHYNEEKLTMDELENAIDVVRDNFLMHDFEEDEDLIFDEVLLDMESGTFAFESVLIQQGNASFYLPEKSEFLNYIDKDYFEKNEEYLELREYLLYTLEIKHYFADDLIEDVVTMIRLGYQAEDILSEAQKRGLIMGPFHIDDIANLILNLMNHTRTMFYRGHTPLELNMKIEFVEKKKAKKGNKNKKKRVKHEVISFPGNPR